MGKAPSVESTLAHASAPPSTSSTALRSNVVRSVYYRLDVSLREGEEEKRAGRTCLWIGYSYGQVEHSNLLYDVALLTSSMLPQVGQKIISALSGASRGIRERRR